MKTKTVIFDLDGLLIDSEVISLEVYQRMVAEHGGQLTTAAYAETYSGRSGITNMEELIANFNLPLSLQQGLDQSLALEKQLMQKGVPLKAGARELLVYLATNGYLVAMASSSTAKRAHDILQANGVDQYFDSFTFRDEVTAGKPHPDIFIKACHKLNQQPADCLVIEDSEAGIRAAHAGQIPVICIPDMKRPGAPVAAMTTAIYPTLLGVIDFLRDQTTV
ncbi:HAD family hydrolase [Lactiplantibacillus carotarum]|uniref:HAD family hydrolase n=1 Tax=Lactiplantibacillus carotarum TaxID=2993456 RepID=UPI00298F0F64|nr:HAD family phosphatase [Lactiplantibacillus carotarum]